MEQRQRDAEALERLDEWMREDWYNREYDHHAGSVRNYTPHEVRLTVREGRTATSYSGTGRTLSSAVDQALGHFHGTVIASLPTEYTTLVTDPAG